MGDWRYELCAKDGTDVQPIHGRRDPRLGIPLNGIVTGGCGMRLDDPLADRAMALAGDLMKVYRDDKLLAIGPLISGEETAAENGTGAVVASMAGPFWRLGKRLVGMGVDANGKGVGYAEGTPLAPVDKSLIAQHVVENLNSAHDTGIRVGVVAASGAGFVGPWYFKVAAEAVNELGPGRLDGFDFRVRPTEPTADAIGMMIGEIDIVPALGQDRTESVVYEYYQADEDEDGGLRNVSGYKRIATLDSLMHRAWSLPSGFPDAAAEGQVPIASTYDSAASQALHAWAEGLVSDDLSVDDFRKQLADEHVRVRRNPRQQITFDAIDGRGYSFPDEVDLGDLVTARARIADSTRFDAAFRCYGFDFAPDDFGKDNMAVTVIG